MSTTGLVLKKRNFVTMLIWDIIEYFAANRQVGSGFALEITIYLNRVFQSNDILMTKV